MLIILISIIIAILTLNFVLLLYVLIKQNKNQTINNNEQQHLYKYFDSIHNLQSEKLTQFDEKLIKHTMDMSEKVEQQKLQLTRDLNEFRIQINENMQKSQINFDKHIVTSMNQLQSNIQNKMQDIRQQITNTLTLNADNIGKQLDKLANTTDERLKSISGQVEKRLTEGFEKTTATFTDVLKRLALIDEAQKKITELSSNVISLQQVLADKRSRGAFGEVQLSALIRNMLPENSFAFQYQLSNAKRADCILFLPEPTGNIIIDAKFPLENYQKMASVDNSEFDKKQAEQMFRQDIRKHIQDIAEKYIIAGETSDGAVMFIPAEAVFAEIHAHYPDLIEYAHKARVWLASPTTMMAILTTARAVLKDADTRKQVHVIQEHLSYLAKDFDRFQKRMDTLARHIYQANEDVQNVHTSAKKITSRFQKIEKVELDEEDNIELLE